MTLSLHIAAQPACVAPPATPSTDQEPADAQQDEPGKLFSEALGLLQQAFDQDVAAKPDDTANEKASDDAAAPLPDKALTGMTQPILQAILATPIVSDAAMRSTQLAQSSADSESKKGEVLLHMPSGVSAARISLPDVVAAKIDADGLLAGSRNAPRERIDVPQGMTGNAIVDDAIRSLRAAGIDATVASHVSRTSPAPMFAVSTDTPEAPKDGIFISNVTFGTATATQAADSAAPVSQPSVVKLAAEPAQSRSPLLDVLGERIRLQVERHSEQATIRLDPPTMGRIEIMVRHEAGVLQVQLNASNAEVVRQLQAISDHLRQDLVQRQYTDVSVSVSSQARDNQQQQHQQEHAEHDRRNPGRALADEGQGNIAFALSSNID